MLHHLDLYLGWPSILSSFSQYSHSAGLTTGYCTHASSVQNHSIMAGSVYNFIKTSLSRNQGLVAVHASCQRVVLTGLHIKDEPKRGGGLGGLCFTA